MDLNLSESLYAYDLLLKQGKDLISEMVSKDVDKKDASIMKAFRYQYYYYYLYYYFNNIRRTRLSGTNLSQSNTHLSRENYIDEEEDYDIVQNNFHSSLMESVYIGQFSDVIPLESSLAPVKLYLGKSVNLTKNLGNINFAFTWNMFDSIKSIKIFTKVLCKDLNIPYDERLSFDFENQILEASIVECDFALLLEMLVIEQNGLINFDEIFNKKIGIYITIEQQTKKLLKYVNWDLMNNDSEVSELIKKIIKDYKIDENQLGIIIYNFKREIIIKKRELIIYYTQKLFEYSLKHELRTPFICRKDAKFIVEQGPFLLSQKLADFIQINEKFRKSYKERFKILIKLSSNLEI